MEKRDARKLTAGAKEEIRCQAVKLHLKGQNNSKIAQALEVHRSTVSVWITRYKCAGMKVLKAQKVGRKIGIGMQLSLGQQDKLRKAIQENNPEQLKLAFALWTRETVCELIVEHTGKRLDLRQVGRYLKRWGFITATTGQGSLPV